MRLPFAAFLMLPCGWAVAQPSHDSCVDVQVGSAQSYDCINEKLAAELHHARQPDAPYSAVSPGNVTGQFNESATHERLGSNFGKSVTPQRPVQVWAPPFASPKK